MMRRRSVGLDLAMFTRMTRTPATPVPAAATNDKNESLPRQKSVRTGLTAGKYSAGGCTHGGGEPSSL
jgi:hypothetical protein